MDKQVNEFLEAIVHLAPTEFIGLVTYMNIPLTVAPDSKEPRDAMALVDDAVGKFKEMNRLKRRRVLKLVRASRGEH